MVATYNVRTPVVVGNIGDVLDIAYWRGPGDLAVAVSAYN